jgi:predicted dehydrogenase
MKKIKIGVFGAGHLGKIHLKCIREVPTLSLVGFYDIDQKRAEKIAAELDVTSFSDPYQLIAASDAVDIVTPTPDHFAIAKSALELDKHVFIEKPVTSNREDALTLMQLHKTHPVVVQIGHVERFNPAMLSIKDIPLSPKFIEVHRLAMFNPRGTDVSVILDLMIHDLDIILSMVPSAIKQVQANGVNIVSPTADIGNARIEWENGCVANITASRISLKNMRKMRLFQPNAYIGLDFLEKNAQIIRLFDQKEALPSDNMLELESINGTKYVHFDLPESKPVNAIQMELDQFSQAITNHQKPAVGLHEGFRALDLALKISEIIETNRMDK